MTIDRVAKAMTDANGPRGWRGPSGPAFTARVMAPIDGRPSPGFTSRVMTGIDAPAAQGFSAAFKLALIPAALALVTGAFVLLRGSAHTPAIPPAPVLATNAGPRVPDAEAPEAARPSRITRASRAPVAREPAVTEPPPIYMIAALEGPGDIAHKNIEPAACTIPPLAAPAPLKLPDLPANAGGSPKEIKE